LSKADFSEAAVRSQIKRRPPIEQFITREFGESVDNFRVFTGFASDIECINEFKIPHGGNPMRKAMTISSINMDPVTNSPIIILKEIKGKQSLPIWVGLLEATAIASEIEDVKFSRPMTHDLLKNIMDKVDIKVNKIEICDLRDNTYYALIHLTNKGETLSIDSRPSDAIALALRTKAPILVSDEVLKKSKQIETSKESVAADKSEQGKRWQDILEKLKREDFGKHKM
jgi:bifunctional DNase/RNase